MPWAQLWIYWIHVDCNIHILYIRAYISVVQVYVLKPFMKARDGFRQTIKETEVQQKELSIWFVYFCLIHLKTSSTYFFPELGNLLIYHRLPSYRISQVRFFLYGPCRTFAVEMSFSFPSSTSSVRLFRIIMRVSFEATTGVRILFKTPKRVGTEEENQSCHGAALLTISNRWLLPL